MAAIQTIRKWGVALLIVIGLGLFAFIAEDFFRVFDVLFGSDKRHVGQVYNKKLGINEYQAMIEEFTEAIKFTSGQTSLNDMEQNKLKDQVWQTFVNAKLVEHEAEKLGLTVTDEELNNVINNGTNPMLLQTPFVNQETKRFDVKMLKQFLTQYEQLKSKTDQIPQEYLEYYQKLFNYWNFIEKTLRTNLLNDKYQALVGRSIISNPISAKLAFEGSSKSNAVVASIPFTSVPDKEINVTDEDIKKEYGKNKELFNQLSESRDIKFISVQVKASDADKTALKKEMDNYAKEIANEENVAGVVSTSNSLVPYATLPVSKNILPRDIQTNLDSMTVGSIKGPYMNAMDNTYNIIKFIATAQTPDSIQYRVINCANADLEAAKKTADSVTTAIAGGAKFEEVAKVYKQSGESQWLTTPQYDGQILDADNSTFIKSILNGTVNKVQKVELAQNVVVIEVLDRKAVSTKYNVAVVKRTIDFSKETYSKAYNDFSHFIASNGTLEQMEKTAKQNGYNVQERKDMFSYEHYVAGIPSTREALRWIFDANKGDMSQLYECGNNDHLLIVCVTGVHPAGYRDYTDARVKDAIRNIVMREKKAEKIMASLKGKNVEQAMANASASKDELKDITFNSYAQVASTGSVEPALAAGVSNGKVNSTYGPVKGNNGVFVYQVTGRTPNAEKFDQKKYDETVIDSYLRCVGQFTNDLYMKADVKDRRYLYF